jgi:hypothetical protein
MSIAASRSLTDRIKEFLSTTRVGIDFGEHAGGIAVVRGNEVLHAETFLDFHEANLEQRRLLRRGRRSRHAKKMRLARLRSWVLRQKLPDGERLPDPYKLMRNHAYMVQPGIYKKKGIDPTVSTSWVELAKNGKADAAGFVRALTLIFQKRGYKWDAIDLQEMSTSKLKEFLLSARIPTNDPTLSDQVRARIEQFKTEPESSNRRKTKVSAEELEACFQLACERGKKPACPRVAEHRSVKEADVRDVVDGFTKSTGIPQDQAERWKKELCGLLNKTLRPARFENRLKTGCSWCGKATPRKANFRELSYRAAVNNLRIRENFSQRPLNDSEKHLFLEWWADREKAPGADAIAKRLSRMNSQKQMARQLHDLLKNDKPTGRTSLCVEHLKMAAEGKTMKDAGVDWQSIAVRKAPNPCGERRDARILHRLEQILFKAGQIGEAAWRYGPVSFINLEIPEPDTEKAAKGTQKEKKLESLKDRLETETEGCVYKVLGGCCGEMDKDHIFPRSREGPDVQSNLAASCVFHNKEKGNQTPYEWLAASNGKWRVFSQYVNNLKISERKKRILLNETGEYPEGDPSPLARIGARPRQFVVALTKLFKKYNVAAPRLDYKIGERLVQRIRGRETNHFRFSWFVKPDGEANFSYPKNRASLYNHAEDAAILACIPPHTWRDRVLRHTADRTNRNGEMKPRPGLAVPELAPDWAAYMASRSKPLVQILGSYPVTWKSKFADLTFWREPQKDTPKLKAYKLLKNIGRKDFRNITSEAMKLKVEAIADDIGMDNKDSIIEAVARKKARDGAKRSALEQELPRAEEELEQNYPKIRRVQVSSQKGGRIAVIRPSDGPPRKVQIKPASEGLIVWQERGKKKAKTEISVLRPRPLQAFGIPRVDPPIPAGASIVGQIRRHDMIWLKGEPDRPEGFYRVRKCQTNGITVQAEEVVPAEILRRIRIKLDKPVKDEVAEEDAEKLNFPLGKQALVDYFTNKKNRNGRPAGREE